MYNTVKFVDIIHGYDKNDGYSVSVLFAPSEKTV